MKKVLLLLSVATIALSSCKKIHTCECEVWGFSVAVDSEVELTKKEAKEWCESSSEEDEDVTCTLK